MGKIYDKVEDGFEIVAGKTSKAAGSFWTVGAAVLVVAVWAASGPLFGFSETWQLVINTGTTIVTFLMVFVIQHSQNKDTRAMQLKLNELVSAIELASYRLIDIEDLSEREIERLAQRYTHLSSTASRLDEDPGPGERPATPRGARAGG
jgi:low affinity Fe/Cu permease